MAPWKPCCACRCDGSEFTGTYAQRMSMEQLKDYHRQRLLPVAGDPRVGIDGDGWGHASGLHAGRLFPHRMDMRARSMCPWHHELPGPLEQQPVML